MRYIAPIVRLIGLIALFWTYWPLAAICLFGLAVVGTQAFGLNFGFLKSLPARFFLEIVGSTIAIYGIAVFPLLDASTATTLAWTAGVLTFVSLVVGPILSVHFPNSRLLQ